MSLLNSLPKELEDIIMDYKKDLEVDYIYKEEIKKKLQTINDYRDTNYRDTNINYNKYIKLILELQNVLNEYKIKIIDIDFYSGFGWVLELTILLDCFEEIYEIYNYDYIIKIKELNNILEKYNMINIEKKYNNVNPNMFYEIDGFEITIRGYCSNNFI